MSERAQPQRPDRAEPQAVRRAPVDAPVRARASQTAGVALGDDIVQAKLTVGASNDAYEVEADAVARRVVQALGSASQTAPIGPDSRVRRRFQDNLGAGATTEPAARVRRAATSLPPAADLAAQTPRVQRAARIGAEGGELDAETARLLDSSRSGGSPLPAVARSTMEGAFGADFSSIRVHTDSASTELNDRIQAKAFTTGSDIYFRDGAPDVSSQSGQALLAHELTHTVQQGAAPLQRTTAVVAGMPTMSPGVQRFAIQRVFTAATPSTYDDGGGHALLEHGPKRPESEHEARAKSNAPSYASSGWASEDKMKTAVMAALATRSASGAKIMKSATKYYKRWTVNVTLAACGYTWKSNAGKDPVTKTESGTAVVIFDIDESTGDLTRMVTAFPGDHAKQFNATA